MEYTKVQQSINDVVGDNVKKLAQLFPSAVKDGEVDFEALKEELGQFTEVDSEKYELTWAGKKNAKKIAQEDIIGKTLKFIPEDSKNADTTENLYIEGDNLEVLKLLRQNYYGAIKMIYIDPPYNSGNDFIYNDSFEMNKADSDMVEGVSNGNERYAINKDSQNRFHANWLNMIYSRLIVARDLLKDNGVIFISIDDVELSNLQKVCDEVFHNSNFVGCVVRTSKTTSFRGNYFAPSKDYILVYAKNIYCLSEFHDEVTNQEQFNKIETEGERKGEYYRDDIAFYLSTLQTRPNQRYFIECPDGELVVPPGSTFPINKIDGEKVLPNDGDGVWRWETSQYLLKKDLLAFKQTKTSPLLNQDGERAKWNIYTKSYLNDKKEKGNIPRDMFEGFLNRNGSEELKKIDIPFSFPKPSKLIKHLMTLIDMEEDDIVIDFFSGAASTAHAVMRYNSERKKCKYILIQLPEVCQEGTEALKNGFANICEIGKERIRRAGEKIKEENPEADIDIGFKVFRVADTNIKWNSLMAAGQLDLSQIETTPDLVDFMPGANDVDIVYELMLRQRDVALSETLEQLSDIGSRTYLYASSYLVCLETEITVELINKLAELDPLPIKFIFRDSAFKDDIALKDETFRRLKALASKNAGTDKPTYTVEFI